LNPRKATSRGWERLRPTETNTGVLTKLAPALDIDIRNALAAAAIEALVRERFADQGAVLVRIGHPPKRAIFFRTDTPFKKIAVDLIPPFAEQLPQGERLQKLEFLGDGQQLIVDGIHPDTHRPYVWLNGRPGEVRRAELPTIDEAGARELIDAAAALLEGDFGYTLKGKSKPGKRPAGATDGAADWGDVNYLDHDWLVAEAMRLRRGGLKAGAIVNMFRARVSQLAGVDEERKARRLAEIPAIVASTEERSGEENAAPASLMRTKKGPINNLFNTRLILETHPAVKDLFTYDEMLDLALVNHAIPRPGDLVRPGATDFTPRPLRDEDVTDLQAWIQRLALPTVGKAITYDAVLARARDRVFHPVRAYLRNLVWDGKSRVGQVARDSQTVEDLPQGWLTTYFGVADTEYTREVGLRFLLSMVARIYQPGCKADYMLVLEGEQGALNSQACAILAGKWFSNTLPEINRDKAAMEHLPGVWLVEVAELHPIRRAEVSTLKNFLSTTTDRYRAAYGRATLKHPRQCVFVGTTNEQQYLRDQTGNRRFWPVRCGTPDLDALRRDRDQLFAEVAVSGVRDQDRRAGTGGAARGGPLVDADSGVAQGPERSQDSHQRAQPAQVLGRRGRQLCARPGTGPHGPGGVYAYRGDSEGC
jgi:hypothetical protein